MKRPLLTALALLLLPALACNFAAGGRDETRVPVSTTLTIPTVAPERTGTAVAILTPVTVPSSDSTAAVTPTAADEVPSVTAPPCIPPDDWVTYTVRAGDTLFTIARRTGSTVAALTAANCLTNPERLLVGDQLQVPQQPATPPPTASPPPDIMLMPAADCYGGDFQIDYSVEVGERFKTFAYPQTTLYTEATQLRGGESLPADTYLWITDGPFCFTETTNGAPRTHRRWLVQDEEGRLSGWIDEYTPELQSQQIGSAPQIISFTAAPAEIRGGETITLTWEVRGASQIAIFAADALQRFGSSPVSGGQSLPPQGSLTVTPPLPLTQVTYSIGMTSSPESTVSVPIRCRDTFFVDVGNLTACPAGPVTTGDAAYQPFENGFMIWEPGKIWVFAAETPSSHLFTDEWGGETLTYDTVAPPGMYLPVRGFGKIWLENEWVQRDLGFALTAEQGYTMRKQTTQTSYASTHTFMTLPDGRALHAALYFGPPLVWDYVPLP